MTFWKRKEEEHNTDLIDVTQDLRDVASELKETALQLQIQIETLKAVKELTKEITRSEQVNDHAKQS